LGANDITVTSWETLLKKAEKKWDEFLDILIERAPEDERLSSLKNFDA